ncbi:nicotinamide N-methyltransferase-like [Balaenoptera ricei]|uniref:nicotinamide N-methyltransferase-like n=1 Tax=Balaenoptera ricei TaxID=2746895 RepID=UPI0028BEFE02|nr:nicotinamide N-methyltransferase-like [Balaenoptera ricei]
MCVVYAMSMTQLVPLSFSLHSRDRGAEKEERLRRAIRQVLKCDILKERPLEPAVLPRPRGHLVLSGDFEASFFMVGVKRFSALPVDEKFLREALQETCFITEKLEEFPQAAETRLDNCSDYTRFFFLVARRRDRGSDLEEWAASRAGLHHRSATSFAFLSM